MKSFAQLDKEIKGDYLNLLSTIAKLSRLFSESHIPYIYYRAAENIFCKSFNALNLSRGDSAFDANYKSVGIGLKTFISEKNSSSEKVAEFNKLSNQLKKFSGIDLAFQLAKFRNERISLACRLYNINDSIYHIVARRRNELLLFETDYDLIDLNKICNVKQNSSSLQFYDGNNFYTFNFSKSTLFRKFIIPTNAFSLKVDIIEDPYSILFDLLKKFKSVAMARDLLIKGKNYVILPLYGLKNKHKYVFEKSGLNQWNAGGRKRNSGELYIPIPSKIHSLYPDFFPEREVEFNLQVPSGEKFKAKVCQDNSKALMTNPNKALSDWLLRKVFSLKEGELATIKKLNELGFDSVIITKENNFNYKVDKAKTDSYEEFINV